MVQRTHLFSPGQPELTKWCWQVGSIIFLAEWGDRSMLATVALGASHSPAGKHLRCILISKVYLLPESP